MLRRADDRWLVAQIRAGSEDAADEMVRRYRSALHRAALRVVRDSHLAEDVVQEALWRAVRALRRDDRPVELRPWLFRLVRNCALDELSRRRFEVTDAADERAGGTGVVDQLVVRDRLHGTFAAIAMLTSGQRHALLRTVVDGAPHKQVAGELGLSVGATKSLVKRARQRLANLENSDACCADQRQAMLDAALAGTRNTAAIRMHLSWCGGCRAYLRGLRRTDRALKALAPGALLLPAVLAGKLGLGPAKAVGVLSVAATVGMVGTQQLWLSGAPSPSSLNSPALHARVPAGTPIPPGTAVARRTIAVPGGTLPPPSVRLRCPVGLEVSDLLEPVGGELAVSLHRRGPTGLVHLERRRARSALRLQIGVLCVRRRRGSLVARNALRVPPLRQDRAASVMSMHVRPGSRALTGTLQPRQPYVVIARSKGWVRVLTDLGQRGWIRRR